MSIIFKYVWRNILEKKLRTLLILFSVAMSSALLFASLAIGDTLTDMYTKMITSGSGEAELIIKANKKSDTEFVNPDLANEMSEYVQYAIGAYLSGGSYSPDKDQSVQVELKGFDLKDLVRFNPFDLNAPGEIQNFSGKEMIINSSAAKKYKLALNDKIKININGDEHWFRIVGIASPKGPFYENGRTFNTVVPRETLAQLNGGRTKSNTVFVKLNDSDQTPMAIEALSEIYRKCDVKEAYTKSELKRFVSQITTPFLMMTLIVLFMSIFIIYTSFKVITLERLPVIGTFRSIGSSRKETDFVMIAEALAYGVIGGLVGIVIGFGILAVMAYVLMAGDPGSVTLIWKAYQMLAGLLLAVVMALISAILPIIHVSKISVKDIVLNNFDQAHREHKFKKPLGYLLMFLGIVMPPLAPLSIVVGVCILSFLAVSLSATILMPVFTKWMIRVLEPLFSRFFGNIGFLAAKNINDNKSILTNISLLSIGMSGIIMITTMSTSVQMEVGRAYKDYNYDVLFNVSEANNVVAQSVRSSKGVQDIMPTYAVYQLKVANTEDKRISVVRGVDTVKFNNFYGTKLTNDQLKQMEESRCIILGDVNRITLGLNIGDTITFKTDQGNRSYKVIGFIKTLMENGKFGFISNKYIKMDFGVRFYDDIYVISNEPNETVAQLKKKFNQKDPFVETKENLEIQNSASTRQIFSILTGFSVLAMIIGVFGVLNNLMISFIQRRRHIAIFKSVGMSQKQVFDMVLLEAVVSGLIGGFGGVLLALIFLYIIPFLLPVMAAPIPIHYDPFLFAGAVIAGILITIMATLGPGVKSSKLNIIESIKYE